jgi:hypothetical protein
MLSSLMMSAYKKRGHGSVLMSPISGITAEFLEEIFVDDTDIFTMLPDIFNTAELLPTAQANLDK